MAAIDSLSWDILEKNFGKQRPVPVAAVQTPAPTVQSQTDMGTAHPDKIFMSDNSKITIGNMQMQGGREFAKSRNLDMTLQGFDIGDVDGDGTEEIILADKSKVKDALNESGQVAVRRAVIFFDIAGAIPPGATINAVQLTLATTTRYKIPEPTRLAHNLSKSWPCKGDS